MKDKVIVFYHANCMDGFVAMCLWRIAMEQDYINKDI